MKKREEERGIGDNSQFPIADSAIILIKEMHENVVDLNKYIKQSLLGRNKTIRDSGTVMSNVMSNKLIKRFESWHKIVEAKDNGVDIHSMPLKHHKLEIIANSRYEKFGQYLVDKDDK